MRAWMHGGRDVLGVELDGPAGRAYDEQVFQYFLGLEQARASAGRWPVRVLLVTHEPRRGSPVQFEAAVAGRVFATLRATLRDTDVVGWYRQERIVAALLTAGRGAPSPVARQVVLHRVTAGLREDLPLAFASRLRLKEIQLPPAAIAS